MSVMSIRHIIAASATLTLLVSCAGHSGAGGTEPEGTPIVMRHATLLRMTETDAGICVSIVNPWDTTRLLQRFVLSEAKRNAAVYIEPHCGLLRELGSEGRFTDLSHQTVPDQEQLADMGADAILVSPFENSGGYGGIERLGIDLVECADYMETTPLGRAEWMRLYGRLFGCGEKADSLFSEVERRYNTLKDSINTLKDSIVSMGARPTVACDLITGGTWYVPGGNSTIGHVIADAGGDYVFGDDHSSGSLALAPETVFERSADADVWLIRYSQERDMTYAQMERDDARYPRMRAWKERRVFGCDVGRSAYFTETPFHPERLLRDLADALGGKETRYFRRLR